MASTAAIAAAATTTTAATGVLMKTAPVIGDGLPE
jgi:hypothetical protein